MSEGGLAKRPWYGRWPVIALAAALLLALAGIGGTCLYLGHLRRSACEAVERELDWIRARGGPVTLAEAAPPPVAYEENAAVVLQEIMPALERCREMEMDDPETELLWRDYTDAVRSDVARHETMVEIYADVLPVAHRAFERPKCRFDVDWTEGLSADTSHHRALRSLARALASEAIVHAHAGRGAKATESLTLILRMTSITDEPLLMSHMVALVYADIALVATAAACSLDCMDDADLGAIAAKLADLDPLSANRRALAGERVQAIAIYDSMAALLKTAGGKEPPPPLGEASMELVSDCWTVWDEGWYLGVLRRLDAAMDLAPAESLVEMKTILREATAEVESSPRRHPVSAILMPAFVSISKRAIDIGARRNASLAGLACERYRLAHGRYPENLNVLPPDYLETLPLDPYTERTLTFQVEDEGQTCRIYSVGRNLADDGGVYEGPLKIPDDPGWLVKRPQGGGPKKESE
ncbi:MAG: hypothetical protein ACYS9X_17330 [Planctomycetota bacterium]|jgi:hypothetical protein